MSTVPGAPDGSRTVLCVGESMLLVAPASGQRLSDADRAHLAVGGAESTVALYLAAEGHPVRWASHLGDDPLGDRVVLELDRGGVDTTLVHRTPGAPTGTYFKDSTPEGTTVYYFRSGSAASRMTPAYVDALLADPPALLHVSGITPALSANCLALLKALVGRARAMDVFVSLDVNYRPALWSPSVAGPVLLALSAESDIVFVGRDEAATLWQTDTADEVRAMVPGVNILVVKDAGRGATRYDGSKTFVAARPVDHIVDHVGAGDAFAAGVLSGMLKGLTPAEGLTLGHRLAARTLHSPVDFVPEQRVAGRTPSPRPQESSR